MEALEPPAPAHSRPSTSWATLTARPTAITLSRPRRWKRGDGAPPNALSCCWRRNPWASAPASGVPTVDWSNCPDSGVAGKRGNGGPRQLPAGAKKFIFRWFLEKRPQVGQFFCFGTSRIPANAGMTIFRTTCFGTLPVALTFLSAIIPWHPAGPGCRSTGESSRQPLPGGGLPGRWLR